MTRVVLLAALAACGSDTGDTQDTQDTSSGCPEPEVGTGTAVATTYTVRALGVAVAGADVYVTRADGAARSQGTTAADGTVTLDVVDGDAITWDPYPDASALRRLRTVVGATAGAPLVLQASYPEPTDLLGEYVDLPITTPSLGAGEWIRLGLGPCIVNMEPLPNGPLGLAWMTDCLAATEAAGLTHAPLVIQGVETDVDDVRFMVIDDIEVGATDALSPAPWVDGTPETLALSGAGAGYVAADVIAWEPVVGLIDGVRLDGYTLRAQLTGGGGTTAPTIRRVPMAGDAALLSFYQDEEGAPYYGVHQRVPTTAYGAPIAVDNARTLSGALSVEYDEECNSLTWIGSAAADFVYYPLWDETDSESWGVMLPGPSGEVVLPDLMDFDQASSFGTWEVDLDQGGYLDIGDDSTLWYPPVTRHSRYAEPDW